MKNILFIFSIIMFLFASFVVNGKSKNKFIRVENGQFIRDGKLYYYVGANYWYGAILGSTGKEGNRKRLIEELDLMKANGIDNLQGFGCLMQVLLARPAVRAVSTTFDHTAGIDRHHGQQSGSGGGQTIAIADPTGFYFVKQQRIAIP